MRAAALAAGLGLAGCATLASPATLALQHYTLYNQRKAVPVRTPEQEKQLTLRAGKAIEKLLHCVPYNPNPHTPEEELLYDVVNEARRVLFEIRGVGNAKPAPKAEPCNGIAYHDGDCSLSAGHEGECK